MISTHENGAPLLRLHHATVVKGNKAILDDLTLEIADGEHTAILGPNGSGKSSLMKLITRDYYPLARAGSDPPVTLYGDDRWNVFELRALMGIVSADMHQMFLNTGYPPRAIDAVLTGFFSGVALFTHNVITGEMRRKAADALVMMEAGHLAEQPIDRLSTGEARRVLIARALAPDPRALLLDEPTTGLDLLAARHFTDTLRRVIRNGKTVILVTHRIREVMPEIERVILLKRGRVFMDGPKPDVLTSANLSALYDARIHVHRRGGYFSAEVEE